MVPHALTGVVCVILVARAAGVSSMVRATVDPYGEVKHIQAENPMRAEQRTDIETAPRTVGPVPSTYVRRIPMYNLDDAFPPGSSLLDMNSSRSIIAQVVMFNKTSKPCNSSNWTAQTQTCSERELNVINSSAFCENLWTTDTSSGIVCVPNSTYHIDHPMVFSVVVGTLGNITNFLNYSRYADCVLYVETQIAVTPIPELPGTYVNITELINGSNSTLLQIADGQLRSFARNIGNSAVEDPDVAERLRSHFEGAGAFTSDADVSAEKMAELLRRRASRGVRRLPKYDAKVLSLDQSFIDKILGLDEGDDDGVAVSNENNVGPGVKSWGLDRIDSRVGLDNALNVALDGGESVNVYIFDSGCWVGHDDFEDRAIPMMSSFNGVVNHCVGALDTAGVWQSDDNACVNDDGGNAGHGTHVAGIVGGLKHGVAKKANLFIIKVFGNPPGSTTADDLTAGFNAALVHPAFKLPAVFSLSLRSNKVSVQWQTSIDAANAAGAVVVVASGNDGRSDSTPGPEVSRDACEKSPAYVPNAITVAATDEFDLEATYSNYGLCVDIFAPGSDIVSVAHDSDDGSTVLSGTSMSCPHVSGVVAIWLGNNLQMVKDEVDKSFIPKAVWAYLDKVATRDAIPTLRAGYDVAPYTFTGTSPNKLLYIGDEMTSTTTTPDPNQTPPPSGVTPSPM